jgi:hypothetical protein
MKRFKIILLAAVVGVFSIISGGCFGSFGLTKKVYNVNKSVGDKFLNTIVFWVFCIIPVYEVAAFIDAVIFNLIEFWTGSNPIAMAPGETKTKVFQKGTDEYRLTASRNRMNIKKNGKTVTDFVYNPEETTWYAVNGSGSHRVAKVNGDEITIYTPDGGQTQMNVKDINAQTIKALMTESNTFAMN